MATKAKRHIHKYHRVDLGGTEVWACALSDCNHFMPPHYTKLVEGKSSICWNCGESITLNKSNMIDDEPKCNDCRGIGAVSDFMNDFINKPNQ